MLVHIVDDDAQVRAATAYLLESHGFDTRCHAGGVEFFDSPELDRGCILLDLRMPAMDGHEVQEELARRGISLPVVVMSGHGDLSAAVKAMKLGASDFIQKPPREEELIGAIRRAEGAAREEEDRRASSLAAQVRLQQLSRREGQILQGLLGGLSNKAIARLLDLSPRTVEMHRANMMAELGVGTLSEALRIGIDAGLSPLDGSGPATPLPPAMPLAPPAGSWGDKLQRVLESSGEGTWTWDMQSGEVVLSRTRVKQLGIDAGAKDRVERLQELVHPDDKASYQRALEDHIEGRSDIYYCEYRIRSGDGSWRWQEARGQIVLRDPETNAPLRMLGTVKDITEQKEEEEKGRDTAQLLELAQWGAGAGIWEIDLATRQLHLSPRSLELHGLDPAGPREMSLDQWFEIVQPQDRPETQAAIERAVATCEPCSAEFRVKSESGQLRWILSLGKCMLDGEGQPTRLVGLTQDISARKEAEQESSRAQSELIQFSGLSAMETMASTLRHELNQPLTAIAHFTRGMTRRLAETGALEDPKLRDALAGAERSALLAAEIVARLGNQVGDRAPERRAASLSALVREACALALIDADSRGIRLSLDLDSAADRVSVDPVQVQQLLLNLLRNATEALMEVPVPQRRLRVATRRLSSDQVAVDVVDTGPGIPDSIRDRIFEPFVTGKAEGTGIGLSISRTIAGAHDGKIDAEDPPEGGALFRFTLRS
jgi:two-component system sensor kinase FixL